MQPKCSFPIGSKGLLLSMQISSLLALTGAAAGAEPPPQARLPEAVEMLWAITRGSDLMGPNDGWFHPAASRYDWTWLAKRFDADGNGKVTGEELGAKETFSRLDRDKDGTLTAADFDWSPSSPLARQAMPARNWFGRIDANSNGRISREEWEAVYARAAKEKGYLTQDDLRELFPTEPPQRPGAGKRDDGPSRWTLLVGLLSGEIGSMREGPALGEPAPDFTLKTHDGKQTVTLAQHRGKRPVVLVFGSFT